MRAWLLSLVVLSLGGCTGVQGPSMPTDHDVSVAVATVVRDHCSQWSEPYDVWLKVVGASVDRDALRDYAPRCKVTSDPNPPSGVAAVVTVNDIVVASDGSLSLALYIRARDAEPSGWFITEHRTVRVPWANGQWGPATWNLISIQPQPS